MPSRVQYLLTIWLNHGAWNLFKINPFRVLGDDIVIMDGNVANCYRQILKDIGVSAGLAKSIIAKSKFVVEFAKKVFHRFSTG